MATPISYTPLESSSLNALGVSAPSFTGTTETFLSTSTFIYSFFLVIIVGAAFYRYVIAGIYRIEASETTIRKSNEIVKKVTLGLLGVFSLFLILFTVNKGLVTGEIGLDALGTIMGGKGSGVIATPVVVNQGGGTTSPSLPKPTNATYAARVASHNQTLSRLAPNIHTNHNDAPCTEAQFNETKPSCTSLAFVPEETIQMLLKLKSMCGCSVTISGATEPGHLSHRENARPVDLRLGGPRGSVDNTDPLYVFIKGAAVNKLGGSGNCFERYVWNSFTFCDERPPNAQHFHVY